MIKTIKVKKKLRLDELIKYIFDNNAEEKTYDSVDNQRLLKVDSYGGVRFSYGADSTDRFTVEVEETITEDTTFERLVTLGCRGTINVHDDKSLSDLSGKKEYGAQVFALINGKLELIWEAE